MLARTTGLVLAVAACVQPAHLSVAGVRERSLHTAFALQAPTLVSKPWADLPAAACAHSRPTSALQLRAQDNLSTRTFTGLHARGQEQQSQVIFSLQKFSSGLVPKVVAPALLLLLAFGFPAASPAELSPEQKVVAQVWSVVDQGFVDRTFNNNDWMKLRQKAVKRDFASRDEAYEVITNELLKPLGDQYTRFIDPVKYEALRTSIVGGKGQDVSGIGVTLSIDKKAQRVKIVDVLEGSPAAQAELVREALITEVNKVRTDDGKATPEDVAALVRGPVGSLVQVKFIEPDSDDEYEVEIQRKKFTVKPVTHGVNGKTGWIKVKQFDTQTAEIVKSALEDNIGKGADCHVVDLRDNAGGYFRGGVDTAALFLDEGSPVVSVVNKDGLQDAFKADKEGVETEDPLFLLVNGNTASASEIMTGALKDNKRATVVGEKTFGKGVVQTVTPLMDGSGVAVTIAKYQTPNKIDINKKGIEVDTKASKTSLCPDPYPNL